MRRNHSIFFCEFNEDEAVRWAWLRAIEWGAFPAYLSQLVAPILFVFYPWYYVLLGVVVLGIAWLPVRYTFVSVRLASVACLVVVLLKWPAAIVSSVFLFRHQEPVAGVVAILWTLLFAGLAGKPARVGILQSMFLNKIGVLPSDLDSEKARATEAPRQIVIVDDDAELSELYSLALRVWFPDVSIECFQDGLEGWKYLLKHDPDLLIMDINRTGMDGIETLQRLAALRKTYPVFVASGCLDEKMERTARAAACPLRLALHSKPWTVEQLRGEIFWLLGLDPFQT
jgi:CheY-like chemotaxis protein